MIYESWRIQFQSDDQAARAAYEDLLRIKTPLSDQQLMIILGDDGDNIMTRYRFDDARKIQASMLENYYCFAGWLPIKTAPKDASHIQLYRPNAQFVGYYGGANSGWRINAPGFPSMWPEPTHWMPLPAPPVSA